MPKSSNQKLKLIYLMKILLERTDETHSITMSEIIDALAAYDISAERKSLWIISLGEGVTLVGPDNVVEMMNIEIDRLIKQYKK